jgi:hypothetical protein
LGAYLEGKPTMTITSTSPATGLRRPAWLLVATLPAYVAYLAVALATIAEEAHTSSDLTPADIDDLGAAWIGVHALWVVPTLLAAAALVGLAQQLEGRYLRFVPALAAIAVACEAAYLVVNTLAYGTEGATWGESALYPVSVLASLFAGWFGVHAATLVVVVALAKTGMARRTTVVVGGLYALYVLFEVLTYLPVIFGPTDFAGFMGGLPPFVVGIFWAALGGGLLKSRIPSAV